MNSITVCRSYSIVEISLTLFPNFWRHKYNINVVFVHPKIITLSFILKLLQQLHEVYQLDQIYNNYSKDDAHTTSSYLNLVSRARPIPREKVWYINLLLSHEKLRLHIAMISVVLKLNAILVDYSHLNTHIQLSLADCHYFTYSMVQRRASVPLWGRSCLGFWCWNVTCVAATRWLVRAADPCQRQCQVGSLAGAAHLSNDNTGVLRRAQHHHCKM